MKKKIRDLTTEECRKICEDKDCSKCPFVYVICILHLIIAGYIIKSYILMNS